MSNLASDGQLRYLFKLTDDESVRLWKIERGIGDALLTAAQANEAIEYFKNPPAQIQTTEWIGQLPCICHLNCNGNFHDMNNWDSTDPDVIYGRPEKCICPNTQRAMIKGGIKNRKGVSGI